MKTQLKENAWVDYQPTWLHSEQASDLFASLLNNQHWVQKPIVANGKSVLQPRMMSWGGLLPYKYSGLTLEPKPMSPALKSLCQRLNTELSVDFNHVVLNLYRCGRDYVSMHADNEPELGKNPLIASISLGEIRRFEMRPKNKRFRRDAWAIDLHHGSLLVMGGAFQHRWRHALPKQIHRAGQRINITFRQLMGPPGWRSWLHGPDFEARKAAERQRHSSGLSLSPSLE